MPPERRRRRGRGRVELVRQFRRVGRGSPRRRGVRLGFRACKTSGATASTASTGGAELRLDRAVHRCRNVRRHVGHPMHPTPDGRRRRPLPTPGRAGAERGKSSSDPSGAHFQHGGRPAEIQREHRQLRAGLVPAVPTDAQRPQFLAAVEPFQHRAERRHARRRHRRHRRLEPDHRKPQRGRGDRRHRHRLRQQRPGRRRVDQC